MSDRFTRLTISLPEEVRETGKRKAQRRGFRASFSAYIAKLIQEDKTTFERGQSDEQPTSAGEGK